jgi:hypothetical protein
MTLYATRQYDVNAMTLGLQQSEVTVVHAFAVSNNVITYVMHVFSGAEETGQKGMALAGVHRCVWIFYNHM